jgi:hypothetical protein
MNKELEFLDEKHGDNSWGYYPPSKREVAQWLNEWTEKQFSLHAVNHQREQLLSYHRFLQEHLSLDLSEVWVDEHLKR